MGDEQHEPAARFEHPGDFVDRRLERVDVLERQAHDDGVERATPARQRLGARPRVARARRPGPCASRDWVSAGSRPTTSVSGPATRPRDLPSPQPMSRTRQRAAEMTARRAGRTCSVYSGSAPDANARCHHAACSSHSDSFTTCSCQSAHGHASPSELKGEDSPPVGRRLRHVYRRRNHRPHPAHRAHRHVVARPHRLSLGVTSHSPRARDDAGRDESEAERIDRNLPSSSRSCASRTSGCRSCSGSCCRCPFTDRFDSLDSAQRGLYIVDLLLSAARDRLALGARRVPPAGVPPAREGAHAASLERHGDRRSRPRSASPSSFAVLLVVSVVEEGAVRTSHRREHIRGVRRPVVRPAALEPRPGRLLTRCSPAAPRGTTTR